MKRAAFLMSLMLLLFAFSCQSTDARSGGWPHRTHHNHGPHHARKPESKHQIHPRGTGQEKPRTARRPHAHKVQPNR
jgi:Spy/CpxP family protein refolding chaperone